MSQPYNVNSWEFNNFDKRRISDDLLGRGVNGFEAILIGIGILAIIGAGIWGILTQERVNRDLQRSSDIVQVVGILTDFYKNSSAVENTRSFPKARCSAELNEVDFEMLLRMSLTGGTPEVDDFSYILPRSFPRDRSGVYSETFSQRQIPFRCPERLAPVSNNSDRIYTDFPSCNFNQGKGLLQCYLYTSSPTGDEFKVAYRSEVSNCFVVYTKFRGNSPVVSNRCN